MAILTDSADPVRAHSEHPRTWRDDLKEAVRDLPTLVGRLALPGIPTNVPGAELFPVFVPEPFLRRMVPGDLQDPLLRQVLPVDAESIAVPGYVGDPLAEQTALRAPGLLHKYHGRALLIVNGTCAVHCRYCFRRHFPYHEQPRSMTDWLPAIREIEGDPSISEILLSGGDPLTLVDTKLRELVDRISQIAHVKRLRIHTRLPIVIPNRTTAELLTLLTDARFQTTVVIHCNHAHEIDSDVHNTLQLIRKTGAMLLNQAVLLRGVNDNATALIDLSERLLDAGVMPYYLHQMDSVAGAAHFHVPIEHGRELIREMRARLPGYAVPRYVQEQPGKPNKTVLA